jgi:hypothetical protein
MDGVCETIIIDFLKKQKADPINNNIDLEILQSILVFFTGNAVCYKIEPPKYFKETLQGGFDMYKQKYLKYKQKYILLKSLNKF